MSWGYLVDDTDREMLRLLQLDGRRPFSALANELGVSDQTVARRYRRLQSQAAVRVIGVRRTDFGAQQQWLLRVTAGGDPRRLAVDISRRPDTRWVHLISGPRSIETVAMVLRHPAESDGFPLLEQLMALSSVTAATAHICLRMFFGGPQNLLTRHDGPLSMASSESLVELSGEDHRLVAALEIDGRASVRDLSRVSGLSAETVTRRLASMQARGTLYFDVDFDPRLLGLHCSMGLWLSVAPAQLESAGKHLAVHPEISFAAATSGDTNLYAVAHTVDADTMHQYLAGSLGNLPGLQRVRTTPHLEVMKMARRIPRS